jgi:hypothetical protein
MRIKHLLLIPTLIYVLYLDIYAITNLEFLGKTNSTPFQILAGGIFIISFGLFIMFVCFLISTKINKINNFLNKKIL